MDVQSPMESHYAGDSQNTANPVVRSEGYEEINVELCAALSLSKPLLSFVPLYNNTYSAWPYQ